MLNLLKKMRNVLITGAGSYVGESVRRYILSTSSDFEIDAVDTMNDAWKEADFSKYDVVYHVAGIAHVNADPKMEALYYKVNRDLTVEVARAAKAAGVKQFIFMSSQIVFHESQSLKTEVLTADTKENPNGFYGDSKLQAEIGIRALEADSFRVVILRPPMIYGPGCRGNYPVLSRLARKLPLFPYVENQRSMLYIENLCTFVRLMIDNGERGTFWPQNAEYSNTCDMVAMIAAEHGKRIHFVRGVTWLLRLMGHCTGMVNRAFGNLSYSRELSRYKEAYQTVSLQESIRRTEV